ncbi:MAG: peptidylprolyl isomerase [Proteobacteria bacterium]|nr:peptidylprolyl isomerase [Pseudomonadota bacterium]MBI3499483.1 peptidylprolyl isomerase [Pseudomonadota bacterium]
MMPRSAGLVRFALALAAVALIALGSASPAGAQAPAAPPGGFAGAQSQVGKPDADPVVAKVNGDPIYRSDLAGAAQQLPQQYQQMPKDVLYPLLVDRLVDLKLIAAAGRTLKLQDDPQLKHRLVNFEDRLIQESYLTKEVQKQVTDDKLKQRYAKFVADNPGQEEVSARHILLQSEDEAKAVIAELKNGADFAEVARKKSIDPSAKTGGGDLGYFTKDQMVPEFSEVAFKLAKGQTSEQPVKSSFGWHVIRVEDKRRSQPPSFEEAREELTSELSQQIITDVVKQLRDGAKLERFNLDGTPRTE